MGRGIQSTEEIRHDVRNRVIDVAMDAFCSEGVRNVTMDEIAHRLSMSKRTLYQLFADKESLLLAGIEERKKLHVELLEERNKITDNVLELVLFDFGQRLEALKEMNPQFLSDVSRFPKVVEAIKADRKLHMQKAVEFLQRGVSQELFRKDVNFEIIITMLMNHIDNAVVMEQLRQFSPIEVFRHTVFTYLRGCTTPKGMAMMDKFAERWQEGI